MNKKGILGNFLIPWYLIILVIVTAAFFVFVFVLNFFGGGLDLKITSQQEDFETAFFLPKLLVSRIDDKKLSEILINSEIISEDKEKIKVYIRDILIKYNKLSDKYDYSLQIIYSDGTSMLFGDINEPIEGDKTTRIALPSLRGEVIKMNLIATERQVIV
ncbi:MAG: hypothetical protein HYS32_01590 [Candidatus Woesearchaeota archaeon]|nr:MAG: hypothetical protein HYS32_01590 [Candidatus Woesearchaeota archaeon]